MLMVDDLGAAKLWLFNGPQALDTSRLKLLPTFLKDILAMTKGTITPVSQGAAASSTSGELCFTVRHAAALTACRNMHCQPTSAGSDGDCVHQHVCSKQQGMQQ
jgi:hypothetical protein